MDDAQSFMARYIDYHFKPYEDSEEDSEDELEEDGMVSEAPEEKRPLTMCVVISSRTCRD
jgi:hypothetical protein